MGNNAGPVITGQPSVQVTDRGLEVTDGTNSRVQMGDISANKDGSSYGLKVISSDGTTVIIDGTSDMFKIIASGTLSKTVATGASGFANATLSGLGTLAAVPSHHSHTSTGSGSTSVKEGNLTFNQTFPAFVAITSGGAVTTVCLMVTNSAEMNTFLNGSSQCVIELDVNNESGVSTTYFSKYFILQEAAI